jgi:hypothetical protein
MSAAVFILFFQQPGVFAPLERVATKPNLALAGGQAQFMDLAGDGQPDLVVLDDPMPGLYEHDEEEGWEPFRPFTSHLTRNMRDPNRNLWTSTATATPMC